MYKKAVELVEANGWFLARQFETKANAAIHEATTAREIINDFAGSRLDWFVTGYGTGGTVAGVARVLRRERPETRIVLCEPANAQLVGSGTPQERAGDGAPDREPSRLGAASDPGLDARFHSRTFCRRRSTRHLYDEVTPIAGAEGMKWAKALAQKEGIFTGISGGSTFAVARKIAETAPAGSVILCMLPDTGERYMTTPLFDGIEAEMNEEEMALSKSTPGFQFPAQ